ncbi:hypothetical protein N7507_003534 [Penicillium longicatenatum]|nr:hypothetical protein N7507_003534 [Penicillium longicatenatum]
MLLSLPSLNTIRPALSDKPDKEHTVIEERITKIAFVSPKISKEEILLAKVGNYIRKAKNPRQCFQYYSDTLLPIHRRTQKYSEYKSTLRHFQDKHLEDRRCHIYSEDLLHEIHLRRHTQDIHRLTTERNYHAKEESGSDINTD